jgi:hypothetical protein
MAHHGAPGLRLAFLNSLARLEGGVVWTSLGPLLGGYQDDYSVGPWDYSTWAARHLLA